MCHSEPFFLDGFTKNLKAKVIFTAYFENAKTKNCVRKKVIHNMWNFFKKL